MSSDITVVIPTIPPRALSLRRAINSVLEQTLPADAISIAIDHDKEGAAVTRNRALRGVTTEWVAFLDDDDELLPHHLQKLMETAQNTTADLVYPRPVVASGAAPLLRFGMPFNARALRNANYIPVTVLARTKLVLAAGGFQRPPGSDHDDWGCWLAMLDLGAEFVHLPERTWVWGGTPGQNTAGRPDRW